MGKMCMIFDMTGCGLSQMDMELMRFIVNCFKIYWPDLLHILLVYNMPWILQGWLDSILHVVCMYIYGCHLLWSHTHSHTHTHM